jgi:hypothetical protein
VSYCPRSSLPAMVLDWLVGRLAYLLPPRPSGRGGTRPLALEVRLDAVAAVLLDGLSYRHAGREELTACSAAHHEDDNDAVLTARTVARRMVEQCSGVILSITVAPTRIRSSVASASSVRLSRACFGRTRWPTWPVTPVSGDAGPRGSG